MKRSRIANALLRRALGLFVFIGLFLLLSGTGLVSPLLSQTTASVFAQVTPDATMVIGTASGAAGEQVTLEIFLDTTGTTVLSAQLILAFDGATLTSATGGPGAALPAAWLLASHSPAPGELRYLTLDLAGEGQPLNGPIFTATFTIDAGAPTGDVPVTALLADVRDESAAALSVAVTNGVVTVGNQPPVVDSGPDTNITLAPLTIASLNGTVVDDGLPKSPGAVTTTWTQVSGPSNVTFADPSMLKTTATFSTAGTYLLRLTAHDGDLSAFDDVAITVSANQPPTVAVGPDTAIPFAPRSTVSFSGVVNDDGLPNLPGGVTLSWTKFSGPKGKVIFTDPGSLTTAASFKRPGIYVLRLTASDGELTAFDDLTVTVKRVYGGASLSGKFDIQDILLVIDWMLGRVAPPAPGEEAFTAADVDGDSVINLRDLSWMVRKLVGKIAKFPVELSSSPNLTPPASDTEEF